MFTPDGHAIDLPKGATPLDFAYRVHTEIGHNCRGAKINGRIVPLNYSLQTGECLSEDGPALGTFQTRVQDGHLEVQA